MTTPRWKKSLWSSIGKILFRYSPHTSHSTRCMILKLFGAEIQGRFKIRRSARIDAPWNLRTKDLAIVGDHALLLGPGPIHIGARSVVSQHTILTTRYLDPDDPDHNPIHAPIRIEDDAWVATDSLVLPGAVISEGTVVGARAMVPPGFKTERWSVSAGHPVRNIKPRVLKTTHEGAP